MKITGKCPKCGGTEILFVPSEPTFEHDPYIRNTGGWLAMRVDGVNVERWVCRACGYVEQWVDPEQLERSGAVKYWEKKQAENREEEEIQAYWNQKAAEQREKEEREQLRQKLEQRKKDPWD